MKHKIFCDSCGKILEIKTSKDEKKFGLCSCGFIKEINYEVITSDKQKEREEQGEGIAVEKMAKNGFPHKCKKCGYNESEVYDLGASYSDESSVYLFKCLKCGHVERDAYGSSNG
ncbi:hypothetical protein COU56_03090 [Candidatus Pacearchaeota archaeon CG10_big_fil_rev_8_21_14_0_10_31_9]|nr:MAG: hypothetical protein COU56_03090 [Candidatus Pacearchaeota archaeon CG10_big_fil_rev_8_21_14_0_10_31_9]